MLKSAAKVSALHHRFRLRNCLKSVQLLTFRGLALNAIEAEPRNGALLQSIDSSICSNAPEPFKDVQSTAISSKEYQGTWQTFYNFRQI